MTPRHRARTAPCEPAHRQTRMPRPAGLAGRPNRVTAVARKERLMEAEHSVLPLKALLAQRKPLHNVNQEHQDGLSPLERVASWITKRVGSMGFFLIIFVWTVSWLAWNSLGPKAQRFDPFPAFVLWLFISNMIQIFLMPLIMVGQNLDSRHSEARAQSDYEVNVRAEREIETLLLHVEEQTSNIERIPKAGEKDVRSGAAPRSTRRPRPRTPCLRAARP